MDDDISRLTTSQNDRLIKLSYEKIESLYDTYGDDLYMTSKIYHYITEQLPSILNNIHNNREKNNMRIQECTDEQEKFVSKYLSLHKYYYNSSNDSFFIYDGKNVQKQSEEHVEHDIGKSISEERNSYLMSWKYKTKQIIMRKIKENLVFKIIPESQTIQCVLQYINKLFNTTKTQSKYLLNIIGDNILKKNTNLIHFIDITIKPFIKSLNQVCLENFNIQFINTMKYKYHETHQDKIDDCRIVPIKIFNDVLDDNMALNVLCVSCYYSNKHQNSELFLNNTQDVEMLNFVNKLKNTPLETIIKNFTKEYIHIHNNEDTKTSSSPYDDYFIHHHSNNNNDSKKISMKEIHYLWNEYLNINHLPSQLYNPIYKKIITQQIYPDHYCTEKDEFNNLSSSQIPVIQKFLKFWEETIIEDSSEYAELEIEEIAQLFKKWILMNGKKNKKYDKFALNEPKMISILQYFLPETDILENKYICNTRNLLWDKDQDILTAIQVMHEQNIKYTSLYDAYMYYYRFYCNNENDSNRLFVSKSYFEKFILHRFKEKIDSNHNLILNKSFIDIQLNL